MDSDMASGDRADRSYILAVRMGRGVTPFPRPEPLQNSKDADKHRSGGAWTLGHDKGCNLEVTKLQVYNSQELIQFCLYKGN